MMDEEKVARAIAQADGITICEGATYAQSSCRGAALAAIAALDLPARDARIRREALEAMREEAGGLIRIAIWNACRWQGKPDDVASSFINRAMSEPTMLRALATGEHLT
jgi:hypothetical protein